MASHAKGEPMSVETVLWTILGLIGVVGGLGLVSCLFALAKSKD